MRCALAAALAAAVLLGASSAAEAQMQPWEGTYQTNYGPVTFIANGNQVVAQNPKFNGKLVMSIVSRGNIAGEWVQATSQQRCARQMHGSWHWGRVQFFFPGNGTVQGQWSYCDQQPNQPWTGKKG